MIYAIHAGEFAADSQLVILQRPQNQVLRTIGNLPSLTQDRDLHMAFKIPYVYNYIKNYAGKKQKSYKIMIIKMLAILDKTKPDTE
jgi:hypothetical protein